MISNPMRAAIAVVLALLGLFGPAAAGEPGTAQTEGKGYRFNRDSWVYVHLEGVPREVGRQHGRLLAAEIADLLKVVKPFLKLSTKRDWAFYRQAGKEMLWPGVEPEYQTEIDGIVAGLAESGVQADRWDLVALNAIMELPYYYVPWLDKKANRKPSTHAPGNCTAFVAVGASYTRSGELVMGHNNWTNYVWGPRWNVIFDIVPESGRRILMDGLPGLIASDDDFGINSAGIAITETTITGFAGWDPKGKPEFSRARKAMQYSESIDDFSRIMLAGNNGGYANDWLLADIKTGEISLFELGLEEHMLRRTSNGFFMGANFPIGDKLIERETNFDTKKKDSSPNARKARWGQLAFQFEGKVDIDLAKKFEADTYDVFLERREANERTLCGVVETSPRGIPEWDWGPYFPGGTVQSKVIDAKLAGEMSLWAKYGHSNDQEFLAEPFLKKHPEYKALRGLLKDMKPGPWSLFKKDMKPGDAPEPGKR